QAHCVDVGVDVAWGQGVGWRPRGRRASADLLGCGCIVPRTNVFLHPVVQPCADGYPLRGERHPLILALEGRGQFPGHLLAGLPIDDLALTTVECDGTCPALPRFLKVDRAFAVPPLTQCRCHSVLLYGVVV